MLPMAMPIPPSHDSGIKKKVAIPAAQKKDYREAFKVVKTGKKRKKEEMFRALPAATTLMLSPTRSKKHGHLESREEILTKRCQRAKVNKIG